MRPLRFSTADSVAGVDAEVGGVCRVDFDPSFRCQPIGHAFLGAHRHEHGYGDRDGGVGVDGVPGLGAGSSPTVISHAPPPMVLCRPTVRSTR